MLENRIHYNADAGNATRRKRLRPQGGGQSRGNLLTDALQKLAEASRAVMDPFKSMRKICFPNDSDHTNHPLSLCDEDCIDSA